MLQQNVGKLTTKRRKKGVKLQKIPISPTHFWPCAQIDPFGEVFHWRSLPFIASSLHHALSQKKTERTKQEGQINEGKLPRGKFGNNCAPKCVEIRRGKTKTSVCFCCFWPVKVKEKGYAQIIKFIYKRDGSVKKGCEVVCANNYPQKHTIYIVILELAMISTLTPLSLRLGFVGCLLYTLCLCVF